MSFSNSLQLNPIESNSFQSNLNIKQTKQEIQNAIEKLIDTKLEQKITESNISSPINSSPINISPINNSSINNSSINNSSINNSSINNSPVNNNKFNNSPNNIIHNFKSINLSKKNNQLIHLDTLFQKNNFKNKNLILTNIDLDTDNVKLLIRKYRNDYLEQRLYFDNNFKESAKWSDTPENDSCINDVFAFVNVIQNKVEFFRIENILQNYIDVDTKDKYELSKDFKLRRTLILSKKIMELSWHLLKEYLDYSYNFTFKSMIKCYRKI